MPSNLNLAQAFLDLKKAIIDLQGQRKTETDLQPLYEEHHELYANLDEPDGLERAPNMFIYSSFERQVRAFDTASKLRNRDLRFQEGPRGLDPDVTRWLEYFQRNDTTVAHTCEVVDGEFSLGPQMADFGSAQSDMVEISTTRSKKSPDTALAQASPEARQK